MGMLQCTAQEEHRHGQRKPEGFAYSETAEMCGTKTSLFTGRELSAGCWSSARVMEQGKISHLGRKGSVEWVISAWLAHRLPGTMLGTPLLE